MSSAIDTAIPIEDKPPMSIKEIIEAAGGATVVARRMGLPMTTVYNWGDRGSVPNWREKEFRKATQNVTR